jgi:hypothetical protein
LFFIKTKKKKANEVLGNFMKFQERKNQGQRLMGGRLATVWPERVAAPALRWGCSYAACTRPQASN